MLLFVCFLGCRPIEYDLVSPEKSNTPAENEDIDLELNDTPMIREWTQVC